MSLDTAWGAGAEVWLVAFVGWMLPTNQFHQWAHMLKPPSLVRWLQRHGIILGRDAHARHHVSPHAVNYCIATGWCNRSLSRIDLFPCLERVVTKVRPALASRAQRGADEMANSCEGLCLLRRIAALVPQEWSRESTQNRDALHGVSRDTA